MDKEWNLETKPFEIWSENNQFLDGWRTDWYFEAFGSVHGPFESREEAKLAQDALISDYHQESEAQR